MEDKRQGSAQRFLNFRTSAISPCGSFLVVLSLFFWKTKEPLSMLCLPQAERKWEFEEILACQGEKGSPSSRVKKERTWHSSQPEENGRIL